MAGTSGFRPARVRVPLGTDLISNIMPHALNEGTYARVCACKQALDPQKSFNCVRHMVGGQICTVPSARHAAIAKLAHLERDADEKKLALILQYFEHLVAKK
jgi:hypothetical protein